MNKNLYCEECDIEFRIRHESDEEIYIPKYCPFCSSLIDENEDYDVEEDS